MRILLTGSTGFLGRYILASPVAVGTDIVCATRGNKGQSEKDLLLGPGPWGRAEFEHALAVSKPDVVLHCAGATHCGDPRKLFEANTLLASALLSALSAMGNPPRLIFVGSAAEYGFVSADAMPVRENHPCQPRSDYGIAKYAQTLLGLAAAERGLPVMIARLFNPVGVGMPPKLALPSFARRVAAASESDGIVRVGDIEASRDFIDVAEAARILLALTQANWRFPIVNLCSGKAFRLRSLLELFIAASDHRPQVKVDFALLRPGDMPLLVGDTERLVAMGLRPAEPDFEKLIPRLLAEASQ